SGTSVGSSPPLEYSAGVSSSRNANRVGSPWWSPHRVCVVGVRRCPTLPHTTVCSTIGAQGLSFRVRDGSGRCPLAMTAVTVYVNNGPLPHGLCGGCCFRNRIVDAYSPVVVSCFLGVWLCC